MYQEFCADFSENLPRSQAHSEDQFSRYTGVALALELLARLLCLEVDSLFRFAPIYAREKGCFSRSGFQAAHANLWFWHPFGDHGMCDRIENNRSSTISSHGVFSYPDVHHSNACLAFWP
jgi:hypothetical protein